MESVRRRLEGDEQGPAIAAEVGEEYLRRREEALARQAGVDGFPLYWEHCPPR